jgi:hypothetical protein
LRRVADKHGDLQRNAAALDEVEAVLTATPIVPRFTAESELRVDAPELLLAGEPLEVVVERHSRDAVKITLTDERGQAEIRTPAPRHGTIAATFPDLLPGAYALDVSGLAAASEIAPVSSTVLVWSAEELARQGLETV